MRVVLPACAASIRYGQPAHPRPRSMFLEIHGRPADLEVTKCDLKRGPSGTRVGYFASNTTMVVNPMPSI